MEDFLTPVSTSYRDPNHKHEDALQEVAKPVAKISPIRDLAKNPQEALEILRAEPDFETLKATLQYLNDKESRTPAFNISYPSPLASQIVNVLVSEIIPNYWSVLQGPSGSSRSKAQKPARPRERKLLLSCWRSITGINAVLAQVRATVQQQKETKKNIGGPDLLERLRALLEVLEALLNDEGICKSLWQATQTPGQPALRQRALWKEHVQLLGSDRIVASAAEATAIINESSKDIEESSWITETAQYCKWLGRNIARWAEEIPLGKGDEWKHVSELMGKSLKLGSPDLILESIFTTLLLGHQDRTQNYEKLVKHLTNYDQRTILNAALKFISAKILPSVQVSEAKDWWRSDSITISAAAKVLTIILGPRLTRKGLLVSWLTSPSGAGIGDPIGIRRAAIASLSQSKEDMQEVLGKVLDQFGDQLYIKHTPTLQQEVHTQVLLLAAGYIHRASPMRISMLMRSGAYLNAVSNRLGSPSLRARFLGMVVAETLSSLADQPDKRMTFKVDEMDTEEAKWYKSLIEVQDTIGSIDSIKSKEKDKKPAKPKATSSPAKPQFTKPLVGSKIISIEEVFDNDDDEVRNEEDSEDDGFIPYAKPDSDAEDSDEDATLVQRNKPTAPVYIRDLITYLRDTENYDRHKLALQTAAPLIRRKTSFGTEVSDHIEELAALLVGLQNKYDLDNFTEHRLQALIACLVSSPLKMGQWFANTYFNGDYSVSQRATVLTVLGLSARELGGYRHEDTSLTKDTLPIPDFPSKLLPPKMHALYTPAPEKPKLAPTPNAIDTLTKSMEQTILQPLAATAADKVTGPNILKTRTFSSRLAVEKNRKKAIPNALAKVVSDGFFFPLTGRFFLASKSANNRHNPIFQSFLLTTFLKTLAIIMHASGPNTLSLPQMTQELWELLLGVRARAVGDVAITEAVLFGFLTMLELTEEKGRLAERHSRELVETQSWVEGLFGRTGGGAEEERLRSLAAAVLVKIGEVVERYQKVLMGDLAGF